MQSGIATVLASCKQAGKPCGIFAVNAAAANAYVQQGFDFISVGIDTTVLMNAYKEFRDGLV